MQRTFMNAMALAGIGCALVTAAPQAFAQAAAPAAPAAPAGWWDSFKLSGYIEGGITGNFDDPSNKINFGHLYTDRANTPVLNQASLIATRPLDPKATGYDFGFTFQGMYGSDARFTHFFNEFDRSINSRYQFDIVEADALVHAPWIGGGTDLKIGQYPTPIGYEVINPTGNPLYSHSYIYNFSIPIKHTGVLTTTHLTPLLDFYLGFDWGNLAQPFGKKGDNNQAMAGIGGFGLNLLDGNLTILALTHIGPENASSGPGGVPGANGINRYFNDVVVTLKVNDALTLTTELNYVKDDLVAGVFKEPSAYGFAQYVSYALNDMLTLQARGEIWRDDQGFYAAAFPGNFDFTNFGRGLANTAYNGFSSASGIGKSTYEEITLGVNVKPPGLPKPFDTLMIRPEVRYDFSTDATPFNNLTRNHQFTIAADAILSF
jgi:putative OmpL-like beta-barrel porin-2